VWRSNPTARCHPTEPRLGAKERFQRSVRGLSADQADEHLGSLSQIVERVDLSREGIKLALNLPLLSANGDKSGNAGHFSLSKFVPIEMKRRGVETKLVIESDNTPTRVDLPLLKAVARAWRWKEDLISGRVLSLDELAKREGLDRRSVHRLIRLGFLSPRIVEAIAEGRQPPEMTVFALARRLDLPLLWRAQERALANS
jgi:site-specific DNA recombinase